jgi:glycosyltransferase involved in cell wall biosynthesis
MKRRFALVTGYTFHARALARLMNARSKRWRLRQVDMTMRGLPDALAWLPFADAVVSIGGPGLNPGLDVAARTLAKPVYIIWAGSDVSSALADHAGTAAVAARGYVHGAVAPWLVRELRDVAIEAHPVKIAAIPAGTDIVPFPAAFTVLTYLPEPRRPFYGSERVYALARRFPSVTFRAIGNGAPDRIAPPNVHFSGHHTDVSAAIDGSTVLVRLADHDGYSVMVNEALARGRHVIWTHAVPGVQCVRDDDEAARVVDALLAKHQAGTLPINLAGVQFVRAAYSSDAVVSSIEDFLHLQAPQRRRPAQHRIVVSGAPRPAAQTCELVRATQTAWSAELLETSSRVRMLAAMFTLASSDLWYTIAAPAEPRPLQIIATLLRKRRVMHWTAEDVRQLHADPKLLERLRSPDVRHLGTSSSAVRALREVGIEARGVPLPVRLPPIGQPALPEVFTLLLDLPSTRDEAASRAWFARLVDAFAGEPIRFLILDGRRLYDGAAPCVEFVESRLDLRAVYERSTAVISGAGSEDTAARAIEALAAGRYVIGTQPVADDLPIAHNVELERAVRELFDLHRENRLPLNAAGAAFVKREYAADAIVGKLAAIWDEAAPRYRFRRAPSLPT